MSILGLLIVVLVFFAYFMNLSGMDETTEYYMLYEAEVLTEYYQDGDIIVEFDQGRKEYYWQDQLPPFYQKLIAAQPAKRDKANLYQLKDQYIYILPFVFNHEQKPLQQSLSQHKQTQQTIFYVIHLFNKQESEIQKQNVQRFFVLFLFIILLLCLLFIWLTNGKVIKQIQDFHHWVKALAKLPAEQPITTELPAQLTFVELIETADTLLTSLQTQFSLRQQQQVRVEREKAFLASLSHELRIPIAIIAAAVSLLKKRAQLNEQDRAVIEKLAKANVNMQQLTQTLLQLWRRQKKEKSQQKFSLLALVQQEIEHSEQTISRPVKIHICSTCAIQSNEGNTEENNDIEIFTDKTLVQIIVSNLLRNACLYSGDEHVKVCITVNKLKVSNSYQLNQPLINDSTSQVYEQAYGFGFGLYIVEEICQQQNWQCKVQSNNENFTVEVIFS
jgi:signal transduction histidine kinase